LTKSKKVFFVIAGKSQPLVLLGRKERIQALKSLSASPSGSRHIILRALSSYHIEQSIRNTMVEERSFLQILKERGLQEDNISYFCKKIFFYTGGIPRFISRVCISILMNPKIRIESMKQIDELFIRDAFELINHSPEVHLLSRLDSQNPVAKAFSLIYVLSSLGITFPEDCFIGHFGSFIEVIHSLPLYVDECDSSDHKKVIYRVIIPECIVHNMTQPLIRHFNLLNGLQKYASILNSGELLEYLTANTIILRFLNIKTSNTYEYTWSQISECFSMSTFISKLKIDMNLSEMIFIPKFTTKNKSSEKIKSEIKRLPWSHDASIEEWDWVIPNLFKEKHFHKPKPMSMSCDLYYYANKTTMMAFALKNYGAQTNFNIQMLQNEIDKAAMTLKNTCIKYFSLFLFCRTHKTLQALFELQDIYKIHSGTFLWSENKLEPIANVKITYKSMLSRLRKDEKYTLDYLFIPNGMEVILLGQNAFKKFYGDETTKILEEIAEQSIKQNSAFSLLHNWVETNFLLNQNSMSQLSMNYDGTEFNIISQKKCSDFCKC